MSKKSTCPSKTLMTKCGYCDIDIKEENITAHCLNKHNKPRLSKGQLQLSTFFRKDDKVSEHDHLEQVQGDEPEEKRRRKSTDNIATKAMTTHELRIDDSILHKDKDKPEEKCSSKSSEYKEIEELDISKEISFDDSFLDLDKGTSLNDLKQLLIDLHDKLDKTASSDNIIKKVEEKLDNLTKRIEKKILPEIAKPTDISFDDERISKLLFCRSIDEILNEFPELSYSRIDGYFNCNMCSPLVQETGQPIQGYCTPGIFKYCSDEGDNFENKKLLPESFRNLKKHLKAHFATSVHVQNWSSWNKKENEKKAYIDRNIAIGMRIARICYDMYQHGKSFRSFEREILKASMNGCDMGDINHSFRFPIHFQPFVAEQVHSRTTKFLSTRMLQTGFLPSINVQADKGTNVHRTRQFTSVVTIVPDSDTPICFVYLGQPVVKDHSGKGISQSIVDQLSRYDIKKNQLEGASFDGQYFILNVPDHLCKLFSLPSTFIATWDPLHRAGIVDSKIRKDVGFKWLVDLQTKCSSIYKKFNWGKNYELLIEICDMIEQHLANIPTFCATRFANSVRFVFINIRKDYKPIIECLKKMLDENIFNEEQEKSIDVSKKLLRNIQNIKFCLYLSGTADLYDQFGVLAQLCQIVNILPHERLDKVNNAAKYFENMAKHLNHGDCIKTTHLLAAAEDKNPETFPIKCYWPRYHPDHKELKDNSKYMGVNITKQHDDQSYQTRLRSSSKKVKIITDPFELAERNLAHLSSRMHKDLTENIFDEKVIETIEIIRFITDLKSLALQLKTNGSVAIGHQNAALFVIKARKITDTITNIPDEAIKENYMKFLCKLENHTLKSKEKDLDSLNLIKDFLNTNYHLYEGVELILHIITVAAVKISVESVVESLVSRYEIHFDKERQLTEEHALNEMEIAENGPIFTKSDDLLKSAMNNYWRKKDKLGGEWHFTHKSERIATYSEQSIVLKRLMKEKSKLPFMDN